MGILNLKQRGSEWCVPQQHCNMLYSIKAHINAGYQILDAFQQSSNKVGALVRSIHPI